MRKVRAYVDGVGWCSAAHIETLLKSALKDIAVIGKQGKEREATALEQKQFRFSVNCKMNKLARGR